MRISGHQIHHIKELPSLRQPHASDSKRVPQGPFTDVIWRGFHDVTTTVLAPKPQDCTRRRGFMGESVQASALHALPHKRETRGAVSSVATTGTANVHADNATAERTACGHALAAVERDSFRHDREHDGEKEAGHEDGAPDGRREAICGDVLEKHYFAGVLMTFQEAFCLGWQAGRRCGPP
ncbi:hypothetical protein M427DRAFT_61260 [Gonapodya prolifera JEL478]|uniref:Uncharacterized protein n=1 Tax=Gonapodya prolifera (strain JEL478) TaxID=1344416 RepID=A0A139A2Q4_GONPJ|nr:hypothetical protein M427DRAFT_61260 [Gonapodya prolifera JEL478]|eukprot:KXS11052.1 hypothetical protein M427DRAFT_61260 [Gonapodya prolifera JEL478]